MAATLHSWRSTNASIVQRIESDNKLEAQLQERIEAKRKRCSRFVMAAISS